MEKMEPDIEKLALPTLSRADKAALQNEVRLAWREVLVPEWKRVVIVRELTAEEKQFYETSLVAIDRRGNTKYNMKDVALRLLLKSVVDKIPTPTDFGEPVFTDEDLPWLRRQPASITDRLFRVAKQLSAVDEEELERLKNA